MRLDKYLAQMTGESRTQVKEWIRMGRVIVNGKASQNPGLQLKENQDHVLFDHQEISYQQYEYYMLNKPAGYVSASRDKRYPVVLDLISSSRGSKLFPVGRLDLDTEGLLLITDNGELSHCLLSPRKHVPKKYLVHVQGVLRSEEIRQLEQGVEIGDEKPTAPAIVAPVSVTDNTWLELTIQEGRYHQVKRMMKHVGHPVLYLKRLAMGPLTLDEKLKSGESRPLNQEECEALEHLTGIPLK